MARLESYLTSLLIFLHLLAVDCSDLTQLVLVVGVSDGGAVPRGPHLLTRPNHTLGHQHVVQPHQLGVGGVLLLQVPVVDAGPLLDLAQHREQRVLHPVVVDVCVL